jgi:hypothetical protein
VNLTSYIVLGKQVVAIENSRQKKEGKREAAMYALADKEKLQLLLSS